ncbi:dienelactone hydrolase family protein [Megasphaera sueciensis]|jgi:dienelactone hydrolase|uniref:dienelactone hydrolase family protein n=1 Tax=Megasphaera sueciensis TaxID=349094 RepID=UPI003D03863A|nr:dienelactone hydrolase family protein [Megasphaera sp.]
MLKKVALVILPEIYGINPFIEEVKKKYQDLGFCVFSPNLLLRPYFPYTEREEAYLFFQSHIGFGAYKDIDYLMEELQASYEKVIILGFSVGATLAWRCSGRGHVDGIVACYGSRIREYLEVEPRCDSLLLFAEKDSFSVTTVHRAVSSKKSVQSIILPAAHGFFDRYSERYDKEQANKGWQYIDKFIDGVIEA